MTRTAILHMLSAVAAIALVSAFASSPASAQKLFINSNFRMELGGLPSQPATSRGHHGVGQLAERSYRHQATKTHYQFRWWHDYGN